MPDDIRSNHDDAAWAALLHALRQRGRQPAPPFFYARVQRRLLARTQRLAPMLPTWLRRPAYALVVAALVMAVSGDRATAAPGSSALLLHQRR